MESSNCLLEVTPILSHQEKELFLEPRGRISWRDGNRREALNLPPTQLVWGPHSACASVLARIAQGTPRDEASHASCLEGYETARKWGNETGKKKKERAII